MTRIRRVRETASWSRDREVVVSVCCVGAIFHDGAMLGAANRSSDCIRISISEKLLGNQTLPHISQVLRSR
jgi:hypothetical protein